MHSGFLDALRHMMPKIRKWVNGFWAGFGKVPADWKLVFTGHSMGAAFAILAATMAFVEEWERAPDAIVTFAGPRIADETLSNWWQNQGLCGKLLRVTVYNDIVHWLPFAKQSSLASASFEKCILDMKSCFRSLHKDIHSKSPAECRQSCCLGRRHGEYGTCDVWQWLKNGECWLGRSYDCTSFSIWAHEAVNGSRID